MEYIEEAIIATDLAMFFENVSKVQQLLESNSFNWNNKEHRWRIRSLMMTACDICAASKDWDTQLESVDKVYMEFYAQVKYIMYIVKLLCNLFHTYYHTRDKETIYESMNFKGD